MPPVVFLVAIHQSSRVSFAQRCRSGARVSRVTCSGLLGALHLNDRYPLSISYLPIGTEFHDYESIERATQVPFYFATPHHSWERGTNENTNGLIRQYIPKGISMTKLDQYQCNAIARRLNRRPRKRLGFKTPEECFYAN
jgi:transposase, IS30 family